MRQLASLLLLAAVALAGPLLMTTGCASPSTAPGDGTTPAGATTQALIDVKGMT